MMHPATVATPDPALRPELLGVVDAGVFARAAARDAGERGEVALAPRGALTRAQTAALAALLGLRPAPANDA